RRFVRARSEPALATARGRTRAQDARARAVAHRREHPSWSGPRCGLRLSRRKGAHQAAVAATALRPAADPESRLMRLSLSEISTVGASFEEDVVAYAAAGFDAIGVWEMKLPADDDANRQLLAEHGLDVSNCVPAIPSILPLGIPGMEGPDDP